MRDGLDEMSKARNLVVINDEAHHEWRIGAGATLAGVSKEVLARARAVLDKLEKGRAETGGIAAGLGELPLFAAAAQAEVEQRDTMRERLQGLDIDALSPREALDLLYELKRDAAD